MTPAMKQLPEIIYVDGVLHTLYTTPLLPWLRRQDPPPVFDRRTPQCERGYIGRWKIENETLWLTGLYAWRTGKDTRLSDFFGDRDEVAADWFTGPLVFEPAAQSIADGAYPKVTTMFVEAGRIVRE